MPRRLLLSVLIAWIAQPAAAAEPLVAVGTATTCKITNDGVEEPCTLYTLLMSEDGRVRLLVIGDPESVGFDGTSDMDVLPEHFTIPVHRVFRAEAGADAYVPHEGAGECEFWLSSLQHHDRWLSAAQCTAESEIGPIALEFEGEQVPVTAH